MVALEEPRGGPAGPAGLDPTAAQLLDRFLDAADNTAAFLRPNEALASEARSVAKVRRPRGPAMRRRGQAGGPSNRALPGGRPGPIAPREPRSA